MRTAHGYKRCSCVQQTIEDIYISPKIRGGDVELPIQFRNLINPWGLHDVMWSGTLQNFRYMVWRSLLELSKDSVSYQYMEAYRLVEIYLDQDTEFKRVRDLDDYDLIILLLGVAEPPNKMLAPLVVQLIQQRQMLNKPTWIFENMNGVSTLRDKYGSELANLTSLITHSHRYGNEPSPAMRNSETIDHRSV